MSSRRIIVVLALVLLLILGVAAAPGAAAPRPHQYYLSLGDSVAAGWQPDPVTGESDFTRQAYTDQIFWTLRLGMPGLRHAKMGCPGETTASMIDGGGPAGALCGYTGSSQLDAAVAFIAAHPGQVAFITIDIGVNDVLSCLPAADVPACVTALLPQVGAGLAEILTTLRTATANAVPIVGMNYYNPYLATWLEGIPPDGAAGPAYAALTSQLATALNDQTLEPVYALFQVPVADVWAAYRSSQWQMVMDAPFNVGRICALTWMCANPPVGPNIHPNRRGHRVIANTFLPILETLGIG
jgi:lysophospholipase L1-like esterase